VTRSNQQVFVIRLRAGPKVDPIKALRAALKVLLRRFGLRAISVREEMPEGQSAGRQP
jgi:hypothetical protein